MKRKTFLKNLSVLAASPYLLKSDPFNFMNRQNTIRLLRHATLIIRIGKLNILVDPMLSAKDEMDPVQNCGNDIRIPMADLPVTKEELNTLLTEADAIVITHTHRDHWDAAAQTLIGKNKLIFCQPSDAEKIKSQGFLNVQPIEDQFAWKDITISRTRGQHGTGEIGKKMGEVSGFVFKTRKQTIYVAGDTIWCNDVQEAIHKHTPDITIVNAGGARFLTGDAITMTPDDIINVYEAGPSSKIIAVHMDTVNHCFIKRSDLKKILAEKNLLSTISIPADGELIHL